MMRMNEEQKKAYKIVNGEFHKFIKSCCKLNEESARYHFDNFLNLVLYSSFKADRELKLKVLPELKKIVINKNITVTIKGINLEFIKI